MTAAPIIILPYDPDAHFEAVLAIENLCFKEDAFPRETFRYLYRVGKKTFLIARQENKIVGYVSAYATHREGYIASIATAPDSQRQGIGQILIENVLSIFKADGLKGVRLHVRVSNASAIRLYERLHFVTERVISHYYGDGEDGLEMLLALN